MARPDDRPRVEVAGRADLRAWLEANHDQPGGVWLVTWKAAWPDRHVPYGDIVDEALCFGWIDSLPRALDEARSMRLLSPRKPGSSWSRVNRERVERLISEGRMHPAGLARVAAARADGSWSRLDEVEAMVVPEDLAAALAAAGGGAATNFGGFPRSARRAILEWIQSARRPETRAARVAETAREAAVGRRANQPRQPKGAPSRSP